MLRAREVPQKPAQAKRTRYAWEVGTVTLSSVYGARQAGGFRNVVKLVMSRMSGDALLLGVRGPCLSDVWWKAGIGMAVGKEERDRKLTKAEERRLKRFERMSVDLEAQGYRRCELTVGVVRANVLTLALGLPLCLLGFVVFLVVNKGRDMTLGLSIDFLPLIVLLLVLTVVHELIHGITWSFFAEHGWADIEFGLIVMYLTPYCTAKSPLPLGGYILGGLMPMILLGIVPTVWAIATADFGLLLLGLAMTLGGGGDLMIVLMLLRHKSDARERLILDHPTQAGSVILER